MFIESNEGTIEVSALEEFKKELEQCFNVDGGNDIWCSVHGMPDDYPCLAILVDQTNAVVNYFADDKGNMFASIGDISQDGTVKFLGGQYEVAAYQILSRDLAMQAALQFFEKQERPACIEWEDL